MDCMLQRLVESNFVLHAHWKLRRIISSHLGFYKAAQRSILIIMMTKIYYDASYHLHVRKSDMTFAAAI